MAEIPSSIYRSEWLRLQQEHLTKPNRFVRRFPWFFGNRYQEQKPVIKTAYMECADQVIRYPVAGWQNIDPESEPQP